MSICVRDHSVECSVPLEDHVSAGNYCVNCIHGDRGEDMFFVPFEGFFNKKPLAIAPGTRHSEYMDIPF